MEASIKTMFKIQQLPTVMKIHRTLCGVVTAHKNDNDSSGSIIHRRCMIHMQLCISHANDAKHTEKKTLYSTLRYKSI